MAAIPVPVKHIPAVFGKTTAQPFTRLAPHILPALAGAEVRDVR